MLIEKELKTTMFGNIRKNYVIEYINTPFLPEKRFSPKRSLICIIGIMVGLLSSLFFVIIQHLVRQKNIK
jgi:LPS O-antigen subunit length determinant protein (WzzB/FepE family)